MKKTESAQILQFKPKKAAEPERKPTYCLNVVNLPDEVKHRVILAAIGIAKLWDNGAFVLDPIWDNDGYWQDAEFESLSSAVDDAFRYAVPVEETT